MYKIKKDTIFRHQSSLFSYSRLLFKVLSLNRILPLSHRSPLLSLWHSSPLSPSFFRSHPFCILSSRSRSSLSSFRLSRISLKSFFLSGSFPGFRRSSW